MHELMVVHSVVGQVVTTHVVDCRTQQRQAITSLEIHTHRLERQDTNTAAYAAHEYGAARMLGNFLL